MLRDREEAGKLLADKLSGLIGIQNTLVLALPRGGAVVGAYIAERLKIPFDVLIVRKIGHPWQPELAAGAVSETGAIIYNQEVVISSGITKEYLLEEVARQKQEITRRKKLYRGGMAIEKLAEKSIILVDDGVATGATIKSAIESLRQEGIGKLIVAVGVAPPYTAEELTSMADMFICLETPDDFLSVGNWYVNFSQVTDADVVNILAKFRLINRADAA